MQVAEMAKLFEQHNAEFLEFDRIDDKRNHRPDLHAFLLLDSLAPSPGRDMVDAAEHDEIFLGADINKVAEAISEDQIIELIRCGIRYHVEFDCLCSFV